MARIFQAPTRTVFPPHEFKIFLGGSIEQGTAEDWQQEVIKGLEKNSIISLYNPRRSHWSAINDLEEQIVWELDAQEKCDICVYYFDPNTKSPITLLELGKFYSKALVCCPDGYFRKTNVDVFCKRYHIPYVDTLQELIGAMKIKAQK